jgi:MFS family permease
MKIFTTDRKVNKSLRFSILDGASYNAMLGLTQDFMAPFALALKASTAQVGLLAALPNLALALSQLGSPYISERLRSRKSLIIPVVVIQAVLWLPLFILPQLFDGTAVWWLIGLFTAGSVFGALGNPAWGSMMADLVPAGMRGRYFGFRNKIGGLSLLLCFFLGGAILQLTADQVMLGFAVLFGGATLFRLASAIFLTRMHEPPPRRCPDKFNPVQEIKTLPGTRAGRFSIYVAALMLSTHLAGPFFAVYMLRELGFSYWLFVVVTAAAAVANFLFMGFWGRRADKIGHMKVVRLTSLLIPLNPILWLGGQGLFYLIAIQIWSGFSWSGFNLASTNFLYEAAAPERRTRVIAVFNALSGLAIGIGALLGGLIAPRLPEISGHGFLALFLLSGLLRALAVVFLLPRVDKTTAAGEKAAPTYVRPTPMLSKILSRAMPFSTGSIRSSKRPIAGTSTPTTSAPDDEK